MDKFTATRVAPAAFCNGYFVIGVGARHCNEGARFDEHIPRYSVMPGTDPASNGLETAEQITVLPRHCEAIGSRLGGRDDGDRCW